jgi:geranylgeranyl diphosphate synthase type II
MTISGLSQQDVEESLHRYGELVRELIGRLVHRRRGSPWLDELVADYPRRPGKALRPAILLAACQALGGRLEEGAPAAVSIELAHNAFLVHDDVEDDSELRRGRPTLHRLHGLPLAVNAGDGLAVLALEPLLHDGRLGHRLVRLLSEEFLTMALRTVDGQATELGWRRDATVDVTPEDYLEMIGRKSCWYSTIYPLRAGAIIGTRSASGLDELSRFGYLLGAAFQIRDDLLDVLGSAETFGKRPLGDLREGKRTLMLIHLLREASPPDRAWLVDYLARPGTERTDDDVSAVLEMMRYHGSIDFAVEYGRGIGAAAYDAFETAFRGVPPSPHRAFLGGLISYMLERTV